MQRVTIGQLIIGHGADRRMVPPNTAFDTDDFGLSDEEVFNLDNRQPPVIRRRRDLNSISPEEAVDAAVAEVESRQPRRGRRRSVHEEEDDI